MGAVHWLTSTRTAAVTVEGSAGGGRPMRKVLDPPERVATAVERTQAVPEERHVDGACTRDSVLA
jgi:hypothetical protein